MTLQDLFNNYTGYCFSITQVANGHVAEYVLDVKTQNHSIYEDGQPVYNESASNLDEFDLKRLERRLQRA